MEIQVIKRDGRVEAFQPEKIARVVKAAGLTDHQAQDLAKKVATWVKSLKKEKVTTLRIRDKVIEELEKVDEHAYNLYVWYQETKEKMKKST